MCVEPAGVAIFVCVPGGGRVRVCEVHGLRELRAARLLREGAALAPLPVPGVFPASPGEKAAPAVSRCARCRRPFEPARTGRRRRFCSDACRRAAYRARRARRAAFYARTGGDEWATPPGLVAELEAEFGCFELDPCATRETAKAPCFYTRADDGLARPWAGRVFCNPPYSEAGRWLGARVCNGDCGAPDETVGEWAAEARRE